MAAGGWPGLNQHPLFFMERLSSFDRSVRVVRSWASAPSRFQGSLAGCLLGQQSTPGSHPRRTSEMSGSHCGIPPRP